MRSVISSLHLVGTSKSKPSKVIKEVRNGSIMIKGDIIKMRKYVD